MATLHLTAYLPVGHQPISKEAITLKTIFSLCIHSLGIFFLAHTTTVWSPVYSLISACWLKEAQFM